MTAKIQPNGTGPDSGATIADQLTSAVAEAIMTGEIPAGTWLRQAALGTQYGVSRQPVREALRQLQAYGLVELHPRRGALVRRPSVRDVREAYLVRAELEGLTAALAARRITHEGLAHLGTCHRAVIDIINRTHTNAELARANDAFHEAIIDAASATIVARSLEALHRIIPRSLSANALTTSRLVRETVVQHEAIYVAIEAGDEDAARAAMRKHVLGSGEVIVDWFEREQAGETRPATPVGVAGSGVRGALRK